VESAIADADAYDELAAVLLEGIKIPRSAHRAGKAALR
jgi:hypothetical protein